MPESLRWRSLAWRTGAVLGSAVLMAGCSSSADPFGSPSVTSPTPVATTPAMTPEQARADTGTIYGNGCYGRREDTAPPAPGDCVFGDPEGRTVVLFGDSHAAQWFEAMSVLAEENGWRLLPFTKMACPPGGVPVYNASLRREYTECQEWNERAKELIAAQSPDLVVVATRSEYYRVMRDGQALPTELSAPLLGDGLAGDLKAFQAMGARTVLLHDTPVPGFDVPDCIASNGPDACTYDFTGSLPDVSDQLEAAERTGTTVVDLNEVVCGGSTRCPTVVDGLITFRDDDHLAATYAASLAVRLGDELALAGQGSGLTD